MKIANKKMVWWFVFCVGSGGLLILIVSAATLGDSSILLNHRNLIWQAVSLALVALSIVMLKRAYRSEPISGFALGSWQISLIDIVSASVVTALFMAIWRNSWRDSFEYWGAVFSIEAGAGFLGALMFAAKIGFARFRSRFLMAVGLLLRSFGMLALGGFLSIMTYVSMSRVNSATLLFEEIISFRPPEVCILNHQAWLYHVFRFGLIAFPSGVLMTRIMRKFNR